MNFRKKIKAKKTFLTILMLLGLFMVGCSEPNNVETPPWSKAQVEQMEIDEVDSVPIAIVRF